MFKKIFEFFIICTFLFSSFAFAQNEQVVNQDKIDADLQSIYDIAYQNNWKIVTARLESILKDYENSQDIETTLVQMTELKAFVLSKNLNPKKEESFLLKVNQFEQDVSVWKNPKVEVVSTPKVLEPVATKVATTKPVVNVKASNNESNSFVAYFLIMLAATASAGAIVFYKNKAGAASPSHPSVSFEFEDKIIDDRSNQVWSLIKDDLVPLLNQLKYLDANNVKVFCLNDLFSLEFSILSDEFNGAKVKSLIEKISLLEPEFFIEKSFGNEGFGSSRKLILNFPC